MNFGLLMDTMLAGEALAGFEGFLHPFGELRMVRWAVFGGFFLIWAAFPLLYRRRYADAERRQVEQAGINGTNRLNINLGWSWLVLGLAGFSLLLAALMLPYTQDGLQWKVFDPFEPKPATRAVTFGLVLPGILIFSALQYFLVKREMPRPVKLVLAGTRALALWMVFMLVCAPYTSEIRRIEEPFRNIALLDNSRSMGEIVREFAVFSRVKIAESLVSQLERGSPEDKDMLFAMQERVRVDAQAAQAARSEIVALGLPDPLEDPARPGQLILEETELSDLLLSDFDLRAFTRDLAVQRAKRLIAKLTLLNGKPVDVRDWRRREETMSNLRLAIRQKEDEIAAAQRQETPNDAYIDRLTRELADVRTQYEENESAFRNVVEGGDAYRSLQASVAVSGSAEERKNRQLLRRMRDAVSGTLRNLLSSIDARGPTRWDIACELLQAGNDLTVQQQSGHHLIGLALKPSSGQLTLLDLLEHRANRREDRLPRDLHELLNPQTPWPANDLGRLTLYLYSSADQAGGSGDVVAQSDVAELDFLRPTGSTTQLYAAYNKIVAQEMSSDLGTILILGDGHDTARDAAKMAETARELKRTLASNEKAPVVMTLAVGHPRPERVLELVAIKGPDRVIKEEMVNLELRIRADAAWDVEVILYEDGIAESNEIPYTALNGRLGERRLKVTGAPDGSEMITTARLTFVPKTGGDHEYTIKLNRRRSPGEDTYDNNSATHNIFVDDRKIRVLLIAQRLRYEIRYLNEALSRDKSLEFHSFIFDADHDWKQKTSSWSRDVVNRVPPLVAPFSKIIDFDKPSARTTTATTKKEWDDSKYDVVIIGDVHPNKFTYEEREWLVDFVRNGRGGVVWLAGRNNMPYKYTSGDLKSIIPIKTTPPTGLTEEVDTGRVKYYGLTPRGRNHEIMQFSIRRERQDELWGMRDDTGRYRKGQLDGFYWYAKVEGPRDDLASVFARVAYDGREFHVDERAGAAAGDVLVVGREEETGRSLFIGTDEMWRMRRFAGDFYTYGFWQNAIRWAATSRLTEKQSGIDLHTDERRYDLGQQVNVYCDLIGGDDVYQRIAERQQDDLAKLREANPDLQNKNMLVVKWRNASALREAGRLESTDGLDSGTLVLTESVVRNRFEGRYYPNTPGKYEINLKDEPTTTKKPTVFIVEATREQMRELRETHVQAEALKMLASDMPLSAEPQASTLAADNSKADAVVLVPRFVSFENTAKLNPVLRSKIVEQGTTERFAFNLLELLMVITGLLAAEWFIRKLVRLA